MAYYQKHANLEELKMRAGLGLHLLELGAITLLTSSESF